MVHLLLRGDDFTAYNDAAVPWLEDDELTSQRVRTKNFFSLGHKSFSKYSCKIGDNKKKKKAKKSSNLTDTLEKINCLLKPKGKPRKGGNEVSLTKNEKELTRQEENQPRLHRRQ